MTGMSQPIQPVSGFASLGLSESILRSLDRAQITQPTPIQAQAIPLALEGRDVIGIAQTGTGKTFAFALPILNRMLQEPGGALIVVPTRELALQVDENIRKVSRFLERPIRSVVLIGGASMYKQVQEIRQDPRIVVATPGRLIDHLTQGNLRLGGVKALVLDEADRMLDMGFAPQITRILESVPDERQTMLFSATMPSEIRDLSGRYLKQPVTLEISRPGTSNINITQELIVVPQAEKLVMLEKLLKVQTGTCLVFCRTKFGVAKLAHALAVAGNSVSEIHSNRTLGQRRQALDGFKQGRYRILVATDIAARGIDVTNIEMVVNFDLPDAAEDYVHRIGRTGRAGQTGLAISFASPDQVRDVRTIERLIQQPLAYSSHGELRLSSQTSSYSSGGRRSGRGGGSGMRRPSYAGSRPQVSGGRPTSAGRPTSGGRPPMRRDDRDRRSSEPKFKPGGRTIAGDGAFQSFRRG